MQRKLMSFFSLLILFSLLIAPAGTGQAYARAQSQDVSPECPPYKPGVLQDRDFLAGLTPECIRSYKEATRETLPPGTEDVVTAAVGGPDTFGYTYNNAVTYSWITAGTNSGLTGDDEFQALNIGFNFPFYGTTQTQLFFNTNGLITFGAGTTIWGAYPVPNELNPHNFIAPFWEDLLVGSPYNNGGIFYSRGGTAPNRFLVIEWRGVENYNGTGTFMFEAILHENGDIVVQHRSRPSHYFSTVGIEDSSGYQGLQYQYGSSGITVNKAIRFFYPTAARARILAYPLQRGDFVPLNGHKDFSIVVRNTGSLGTDTYDLTNFTSAWPVSFYASNGTTLLSDTDGDSIIDTGPVPVGTSVTLIARYYAPTGSVVGDSNYDEIQFKSSLNGNVNGYVELYMSVPGGFANVFVNNTDGAMSFFTASSSGSKLSKATGNSYFGSDLAVAQLTNGNYFYIWSRSAGTTVAWQRNIEFAIVNRQGAVVRAPTRLTVNTATNPYTVDGLPAVSVAPDGTVGVIWRRYRFDDNKDEFNHNIFFATLNAAGTVLRTPLNLSNNNVWGNAETLDVPQYYNPTIASSSDNRFVVTWEEDQLVDDSDYSYNVWMAIRNSDGTGRRDAGRLTGNDISWGPVVNSLAGGKVIVTWLQEGNGPYYTVLNSSGSVHKAATNLVSGTTYFSPDAVQLPNGKAAIAWATQTGIQFSILNTSYNIESGPHTAASPKSLPGRAMSLTSDALSNVVMTWIDGSSYNKQLYALANSTGMLLATPMVYRTSADGFRVSINGQGTAPFMGDPVISGNAGVAGATLNYTGGSTTSDSNGNFAFKVPFGWSGTLTPSKVGYIFAPVRRTYTGVTTDKPNQNFTARQIVRISGNTGAAGVTLSYTDAVARTVVSKWNGNYSFIVPGNWSGTVTPSHACFTFTPANRPYTNVTTNQTSQDYTPTVKGGSGCADIDVGVRGVNQVRYGVLPSTSARVNIPNVDGGPVEIVSTNAVPLVASERVLYKVNGVDASFSEMLALPDSQLDSTYWLPWYNNATLDTQLRLANVSGSAATVHVSIAGTPVTGSPFTIPVGESLRKSFPGIDKGPVEIVSNVNIVAAERVFYKVNGANTSYSEMMALPASQVEQTYWLPWYNSKTLDTQLRIANVSATDASVHVSIGGTEVIGSPFTVPAGTSLRKTFPNIDRGPVEITGDQDIVVSERILYKVNGVDTSFSEMMALPNGLLDTTYWLPWYNSKTLDSQLRIANVSGVDASVHVSVGGVEVTGSPFTVPAGTSVRKTFPNIDRGPLEVTSDQDILVAQRIIHTVNNVATSFSEMMALPNGLLDTTYWLPWYNSKTLDTQLRLAVP